MPEINEFQQLVGNTLENWSPKSPPSKNMIIGEYCLLELLNIDKHAKTLFATLSSGNNGKSWTYLPYGPFDTSQEFNHWIQTITDQNNDILYVIIDKKTNLPLGIAGFLRISPEHGSIEIGHLHFSAKLKNTTLSTEAIYLMMAYVFDELQYRRIEWKCNSLNEASKNAALRYGFQYEGTFRQANVFKNRNRDTAWFSIIDLEWPKLKIKFKQWLHQDNFSNDGRQIYRLQDC